MSINPFQVHYWVTISCFIHQRQIQLLGKLNLGLQQATTNIAFVSLLTLFTVDCGLMLQQISSVYIFRFLCVTASRFGGRTPTDVFRLDIRFKEVLIADVNLSSITLIR